jgi:hypothetical protein
MFAAEKSFYNVTLALSCLWYYILTFIDQKLDVHRRSRRVNKLLF